MNSCPRQQNSELVSLLQRALDRINLLLVLESLLLLLSLHDSVLQHIHDFKEFIKSKLGLLVQMLCDKELLSFLRIPA